MGDVHTHKSEVGVGDFLCPVTTEATLEEGGLLPWVREELTWRWELCLWLQNGKHDEAWMVLKQVHDTNMRAKGHPERVFSVSQSPSPQPPRPSSPSPTQPLSGYHPLLP